MQRLLVLAAFATGALLAVAAPAVADDNVTSFTWTWVRHDGGTDRALAECNDDASSEVLVDPTTEDLDPNDGGSKRQGNEPYSVVDPTDPDTIVTGWNDYCLSDLDAGWQGFGFSRDGGATWKNSFVPGYPWDDSALGSLSPLKGNRFAGDPIAAFDSSGRLYVGGISFNRVGATNGHVYVARYGAAEGPNGYPVTYEGTVIVGEGTPGRQFGGIFQDKPMLEVDRTGGMHDGNVYVCWSRFPGFGQNKIYFSRSTDGGATFSRPVAISRTRDVISAQGCDIAVEADGDVYVTYRTFDQVSPHVVNGLAFNRSTDGGRTFSDTRVIRSIIVYNPFDTSRDCGDGPELCPSDFVFHRVPLEPRVTSDQTGALGGVYLTYNAVDPATVVPSTTSYSSAGGGRVGLSQVYVVRTLSNGASWSNPVAVNPAQGHQFFPDVDAHSGRLAVVWQDNRDEPADVQFPIGNEYVVFDGENRAHSSGEYVNTFWAALAASGADVDAFSFGPAAQASSQAHQSQYEMFGDRQVPFQGDYNWISIHSNGRAYMTWTDNRDVVQGDDNGHDDLRELDPNGDGTLEGFDDDFDVWQCRAFVSGAYSSDRCPNFGGLDQNIYGLGVAVPAVP